MRGRSKTSGADGAPLSSAFALRAALGRGELTAEALVERCLARIGAREGDVRAWTTWDAEGARARARDLDARQASGEVLGPLHGLPVALKDVIDTCDMATENGCRLDAGRRPERDASIVARLRAAGAIILGKTVTTELAYLEPRDTRNPHDLGHTPGGSSSGSAAAVADGMVPLAVGTQTGGSVIRPASFCGVVGYKPTFGAIPRRGVLNQSQSLDTLGVFAADPLSAAMVADVMIGPDKSDPASLGLEVRDVLGAAQKPSPRALRFGFVRPPAWQEVDPDYQAALEGFVSELGGQAVVVELPALFDAAEVHRRVLNFSEMAHNFRHYLEGDAGGLGPATREAMAQGQGYSATEYLAALACRPALNAALNDLFSQVDAILCPAALGPAPEGLSSTGNSIMNGLWTMAGTPAVTLPLLRSQSGLPLGVQLLGAWGEDGALMRAARWLYEARPS